MILNSVMTIFFQGHKMGPLEEDYIETVLTCEGDFYDPEFHTQLQTLATDFKI